MNDLDNAQKMAILQALDPAASIDFSGYTRQWYVSADLDIGDGAMLEGIAEHRDTPEAALDAYFDAVTNLRIGKYLVSDYRGHRREWRWNGAAFAECTRDLVFERELARQREAT